MAISAYFWNDLNFKLSHISDSVNIHFKGKLLEKAEYRFERSPWFRDKNILILAMVWLRILSRFFGNLLWFYAGIEISFFDEILKVFAKNTGQKRFFRGWDYACQSQCWVALLAGFSFFEFGPRESNLKVILKLFWQTPILGKSFASLHLLRSRN